MKGRALFWFVLALASCALVALPAWATWVLLIVIGEKILELDWGGKLLAVASAAALVSLLVIVDRLPDVIRELVGRFLKRIERGPRRIVAWLLVFVPPAAFFVVALRYPEKFDPLQRGWGWLVGQFIGVPLAAELFCAVGMLVLCLGLPGYLFWKAAQALRCSARRR